MKRFLSFLLATVMVLSLVPMSVFSVIAETATDEQGVKYTLSSDGTYYIVSGFDESVTEVVIPAKYNGLPVKEIGNDAFYGCSGLTSITIPDSVTSIGGWSFGDCSSLTSITIPDSVTSIGICAFEGCSSLESITVKSGNTKYHSSGNCIIETATKTLIVGCKNSVIPTDDSVTSIGKYAFGGCSSLTEITIPDSVTSIGDRAFESCSGLTSITISDSVTSIGDYAFYRCSRLRSATLPDLITSIGEDTFAHCSSLTDITIPDSVTSIGAYAFDGCSRLRSATIPDSVTSIGGAAFRSCSSLTEIIIPDSVTSIGASAFKYCSSLTEIIIPDSITSIGYGAFEGCSRLRSATIPDSVTSIGDNAFQHCYNLTGIIIPDSVTSIGKYAFCRCSSLTEIIIPDSVTSIGEYAFNGCSKLTDIYCEVESKPYSWNGNWNYDCDATVHWGYLFSSDDESSDDEIFDDSSIETINLVWGKSYITSIDAHSSYPDTDNAELTDGYIVTVENCTAPYFNDPNWVGFNVGTVREFDFEVALGTDTKAYDLYKVVVNVGSDGIGAGVTEPDVVAYYTADGTNWTEFGSYTGIGAGIATTITFEKDTPVKATAIKVNFSLESMPGMNLIWVGEVAAYGTNDKEPEATNVALGKSYTKSQLYGAPDYPDEGDVTLTDGKHLSVVESSYYKDPIWAGFHKDYGAVITVDLEADYDLSKFVVAAGSAKIGSGITTPSTLAVRYSLDNETWEDAGTVAFPETTDVLTAYATLELEEAVTARYVEYTVTEAAGKAWIFISEVEAYGVEIPTHECVAGDEWLSDEENHWKACECGEILESSAHNEGKWTVTKYAEFGVEGRKELPCTVCGYILDAEVISALSASKTIETCEVPWSVSGYNADLTEGLKDTVIGSMGDWYAFYYNPQSDGFYDNAPDGVGTAILTLNDTYNVSEIKINVGIKTDSGYKAPKVIYASFSSDKESWSSPVAVDTITHNADDAYYFSGEFSSVAKYIKLEFYLDGIWCFLNEIEVYGDNPADHTCVGVGKWQSDENEHWKSCSCGNIPEKAAHDAGEWVVTKEVEMGVDGRKELQCTICGYALDFEVIDALPIDNFSYQLSDDGTYYIVTGYIGPETDVVIPRKYNNIPVTSISAWAFYECIGMTTLTIPSNVTSIGECTFLDCCDLTDIYFEVEAPSDSWGAGWDHGCWAQMHWDCEMPYGPEEPEITEIWEYEITGNGVILTAYNGIDSDVYVPSVMAIDEIEYRVIKLGDGIFGDNDNIKSVTFGDGIIEIGDNAFYDCDNLICVLFNEDLAAIGKNAFYGCDAFNSVVIYDAIDTIGEKAFLECPNLTIWCGNNSIGQNYAEENSLSFEIVDPNADPEIYVQDGVTYYVTNGSAYAVGFDNSTTELEIPAVIGGCPVVELRGTFNGSRIYMLTLPNSVKVIGEKAFYNSNIFLLNVPEGLTTIGDYAFYGCEYIYKFEMPDSVTTIGDYAFYNCLELERVTISKNVTAIGDYAFSGCIILTAITIPESVKTIGDYAFSRCRMLTAITIPESVRTIGDYAFYGCYKLAEVNFAKGIVATIGDYAFSYHLAVKNIVLPEGITAIGDYAFADCWELESVTLPESLKTIGAGAFKSCPMLTTVVIPKGVESIGEDTAFDKNVVLQVYEGSYAHEFAIENNYLYYICDSANSPIIVTIDGVTYFVAEDQAYAVAYDDVLNTVVIPATVEGCPVTELRGTFANCVCVRNITLPNSLKVIGEKAFYNTDIYSITIPESVTTIGDYAFDGCENLSAINVPESVTTIGKHAFDGCRGLSSITIPKNVTTIGEYAFDWCISLKSVTFEDGISVTLGNGVFEGCYVLTSIDLPESVTEISNFLFYGCSALTTITLSDNITAIGDYAFASCDKLEKIVIPQSVKSICENAFDSTIVLFVYEDSYACDFAEENDFVYMIYDGASESELIKANDITYCIINGEAIALRYSGSSTYVTIPATIEGYPVTEMYGTFEKSGVVRVTLPEGLRVIGKDSFLMCYSLTSVNIPESVTTIGDRAFYNCYELPSITIPQNVTSIGFATFYACISVSEFIIPEGITHIPDYAFAYCHNLQFVTIPEGVTTIGNNAFIMCCAESITIPGTVTSIGEYAFAECSYLQSVIFGERATNTDITFETGAFSYCPKLKYITLPDELTEIADRLLAGNKSLGNIVIPEGVTSIGESAFSGCSGISHIVIPDSVTSIGESAFAGCKFKHVIVHRGIESIADNAFEKNVILLVYENSYAHDFAIENDNLYFVMRETDNPNVALGSSISGTVKYTDGTVAAGATVEIIYNDGVTKEIVTTDENGVYEFTYAEVGVYAIRVIDANGNSASSTVTVRMNVYTVFVSGDTNLVLKRGWSVSGTVSENNASVIIKDEKGNIFGTTETIDGAFAFENIPNGTYYIHVDCENGSATVEVTVFNGAVSDLDIFVIPDTASVSGYVEVADRNGESEARNWVTVTIYNSQGLIVGQCKSDSDGKFVFDNLPFGEYSIVAETSEIRYDEEYGYDRSYSLAGYGSISITENKEYRLGSIVLYEKTSTNTTISGKVTAHGETQDCEVIIRDVFQNEVAKYTTKNNGKYSFINIPDGLYFITATTKSEGMGFAVITVQNGEVYGETGITVYKDDKVARMEVDFFNDVPACESQSDVMQYKERVAQEKSLYDALSSKEKSHLSSQYIETLNKYCEWISNCKYVTDDGIVVDQGGLTISGDEINSESEITLELSVTPVDNWVASEGGVESDADYLYHNVQDAAGDYEIVQYYEITLTKTVDGIENQITSVLKDTDATGILRITMTIPEEYRGYNSYSLIHVHEGEVYVLTDLDDNPDTITFEVNKFSSFVLAATNEQFVSERYSSFGDINGDDVVDSADVLLAKRAILGNYLLSSEEFLRADINTDTQMTTSDYMLVKRIILGTY